MPSWLAATGVSSEINVQIWAEFKDRGPLSGGWNPPWACCLGHTSVCKAVCLERAVWHLRKMCIFRVRVLALDLKIYYFKGDNVYVKFFQIVHKNIKQKVIYPSSPTSISPIGAHQRLSLLVFLCTCAYMYIYLFIYIKYIK
ncbi:hypothetical protein HJG60_008711 [Phyllostomus discolor]|uniref:Uncharacterized protein n=1 Tax=Phyllostomus discolor TaxID=89673 RepID=A0A833YLZ3_9CHIR|nr:hypothetical protein HJG60_008711 [Phyllostomus discolor]